MKPLIVSIGRYLGYEVVPAWRLEQLPMADLLQKIFNRLGIDCVLDVGANIGQYRDLLTKQVGYSGLIVSFEPVSDLVRVLREKATQETNWQICQWALGNENATAQINIARSSVFDSFLCPDHSQVPELSKKIPWTCKRWLKSNASTASVDMVRGESSNDYLKMDTQGYDLEVMKGVTGILQRISALQTEVPMLLLYSKMPDYINSIGTLNELGFDISGMFPVTQDDALRVVEFDCVLLNRGIVLKHPCSVGSR